MSRILIILFLSLLSLTAEAQILSDIVYLGSVLIDDTDIPSMENTCRYYDLTESPPEEGYSVFSDGQGNRIRFKMDVSGTPVVEIRTDRSRRTIGRILRDTGFRKQGGIYVRGSATCLRTARCILSDTSPRTLVFTKTGTGIKRQSQQRKQ